MSHSPFDVFRRFLVGRHGRKWRLVQTIACLASWSPEQTLQSVRTCTLSLACLISVLRATSGRHGNRLKVLPRRHRKGCLATLYHNALAAFAVVTVTTLWILSCNSKLEHTGKRTWVFLKSGDHVAHHKLGYLFQTWMTEGLYDEMLISALFCFF